MGKKTTISAFLLSLLICILALMFSNAIVMDTIVDRSYRLTKARFDSFPSNTNEVMCAVNMQSVGGEFSKVDVSGWAFCETEYENDGKTITVILKAQDCQQCWYTGSPAGIRADVRKVYPNARGDYHGVTSQFVTFGLRNGVYDVFLYVKENENTKGLIDTGMNLVKNGREISIEKTDAESSS